MSSMNCVNPVCSIYIQKYVSMQHSWLFGEHVKVVSVTSHNLK